jgi:hypothetical protein
VLAIGDQGIRTFDKQDRTTLIIDKISWRNYIWWYTNKKG